MIKQSTNLFAQKEKVQVKNITDPNLNGSSNADGKIFSAADLWNIQRKGKMLIQRRWSF